MRGARGDILRDMDSGESGVIGNAVGRYFVGAEISIHPVANGGGETGEKTEERWSWKMSTLVRPRPLLIQFRFPHGVYVDDEPRATNSSLVRVKGCRQIKQAIDPSVGGWAGGAGLARRSGARSIS